MDNEFYPHISTEGLGQVLHHKIGRLLHDRSSLLPDWARDDVLHLLKAHNFIICGSTNRSEIRVLAKVANVIAVVDDHLSAQKSNLFDIPVIDSNTWVEMARADRSIVSCILVSQCRGYEHFSRTCQQWDLLHLDPLQFLHILRTAKIDTAGETGRFFWYGYEFFEGVLENADTLISFTPKLDDQFSRLSWNCILLYRLTLNPFYLNYCGVGHNTERFGLNSYACNQQFFKFGDAEVYVDGGAFTGDTIEQFIRAVKGKFRQIYSFEPSVEHNNEIRKRMRGAQDNYLENFSERISFIEKGLWSSETKLLFNPSQIVDKFDVRSRVNTQSAHLVDSGILGHLYEAVIEESASIEVPVTTIDSVTNGDATFIKLEIEGSELEALKGAIRTIERKRPKMALSIYHKPEDLITIPKFLADMGAEYRLGFRQHNPLVPDATVLYCF